MWSPQGRLQPTTLLLFNFAGAAAFAAVTMGGQRTPRRAGLAVRRTALLIAGTYLLSPLLQVCNLATSNAVHGHHGFAASATGSAAVHRPRCCSLGPAMCVQTLTRTTSSDTVVAVAIYMLLLHLFLHDYRLRLSLTDKAAGAISLAAAVFASVLIASRLDSHLQVFSQVSSQHRSADILVMWQCCCCSSLSNMIKVTCSMLLHPTSEVNAYSFVRNLSNQIRSVCVRAQVLLSLEVYLVLPYALHSVTDRYPAQSGVTTAVCSLVCGALLLFSPPILCLYVLVLCFVTFVCPIWLVGIQRRSAIPTGPWDVADINMDPPGM